MLAASPPTTTPVFTSLLAPFHYDYMVTALWTSALIGGVCGLLSGFVTLKGWSLMGDALSHAVVPGVAIAYLLGLPFAVGAFTSGLLAAGAMAFVKMKTPVREDAVIGIVFTAFFALGLLLISLFPSRVDLKGIIFGNILGIATGDVVQVVIVSAVCLLVLALKWRDLMLFCFDPNQARALGLRVGVDVDDAVRISVVLAVALADAVARVVALADANELAHCIPHAEWDGLGVGDGE